MTVKIKILIPMVVMIILVAVAILVSNIVQFTKFVDARIEDNLNRAVLVMLSEIEGMQSRARVVSLYFANDFEIISALESGNREMLLNRAMQLYNESGVEKCAIADNTGKALTRPHAPEVYWDDISTMPSVKGALEGESIMAVERGTTEGLLACAGIPVYGEQGQLLGAIVIGFRLDNDKFVDRLKEITGCEITIYIEYERIATTLHDENGKRALGTKAPESVSQQVLAGNNVSGQYRVFNNVIITKYIPLPSVDGKVIGMLFAGSFLKEKTDTIFSFIITGIIITVFLLGLSFLFIMFVEMRVSSPIKVMLEKIHYDALTGIYNRRFFDEQSKRLIKTLSRSEGALTLMMIDIDLFKRYNDTYGHIKGDSCLKIVSETLSKSITRADDFVARYGGEEFVIVLPNTEESGAHLIASQLLENIRNCNIPHETSDVANHVTISIGATTSMVNFLQTADDFVKTADDMLYKSKNDGRDRYSFKRL